MGHYMITPERELTRKSLRMDFLILRLEEGCHMRSSLGKLLKKHYDRRIQRRDRPSER